MTERLSAILSWRQQGMTYKAIGERLGISKTRACRIVAVTIPRQERRLTRVCLVCAATFTSTHANRDTCGQSCRLAISRHGLEEARRRASWRAERRRMRAMGKIYCHGCKAWFDPDRVYTRQDYSGRDNGNGNGTCRDCMRQLHERTHSV